MIQIPNTTQYLIESSVCLTILYVFYHVLLRKENHFQWNRFYLLSSVILSLTIPLLYLKQRTLELALPVIEERVLPIVNTLQNSHNVNMVRLDSATYFNITVGDVIWMIYLIGASALAIKLLHSLLHLYTIITTAIKKKRSNYIEVKSDPSIPASSFFGYIFYNAIGEDDTTSKIILQHEMVHVRQWHTLDVLFMEIMVILKWFNPIIYLYRNSLRKTHEFIADQYVSNQMNSKLGYANILLSYNNKQSALPITNSFYSYLRDRLEMLNNNRKKSIFFIKIAMVIPILGALLTLFSFDSIDQANDFINTSTDQLKGISTQNIARFPILKNEVIEVGFQMGHLSYIQYKKSTPGPVQIEKTESISSTHLIQSLDKIPYYMTNGQIFTDFLFSIEIIDDNGKSLTIDQNANTSIEAKKSLKDAIRSMNNGTIKVIVSKQLGLKNGSNLMFITPVSQHERSVYINSQKEKNFISSINKTKEIKSFKWGDIEEGVFISYDGLIMTAIGLNVEQLKRTFDKVPILLSNKSEEKLKNDQFTIEMDLVRAGYSGIQHAEYSFLKDILNNNVSYAPLISISALEKNIHGYSVKETIKPALLLDRKNKTFEQFFNTLRFGDAITIRFLKNVNGKSVDYLTLFITIEEENIRHNTKVLVDAPSNLFSPKEESRYQMITTIDDKYIIRMDTLKADNKSLLESFNDRNNYTIKHVPNFITDYRVIPQSPLENHAIKICNKELFINHLDGLTLPDFTSDTEEILMRWGSMLNSGVTGNFIFNELEKAKTLDPEMIVEGEKVTLERYDLTIIDQNDNVMRFRSNSLKSVEIINALRTLDQRATIIFNNLILSKGNQTYFMHKSFKFALG